MLTANAEVGLPAHARFSAANDYLPPERWQRVVWTALLIAHTLAALLALPIGALNLLRRPRGDEVHRALGWTWTRLMYWVALSSFWIRERDPGRLSWIHALSVLTLVTLTLGVFFGLRGHRRAHRANMTGTYLGLVGAFAGAVAVPDRAVPQLVLHRPVVAGASVALVLVATWLSYRISHFAAARRLHRAAKAQRAPRGGGDDG